MGHPAGQPGNHDGRYKGEQRGCRGRPLYHQGQQGHLRRRHRQEHQNTGHQGHGQGQRQDLQGHRHPGRRLPGPQKAGTGNHREKRNQYRPGRLQRLQKAVGYYHEQEHQTVLRRQECLLRHQEFRRLRLPQEAAEKV